MKTKRLIGLEMRNFNNQVKRAINKLVNNTEIGELTALHGWVITYLFNKKDCVVLQKDFEQAFSIQRSTASRVLKLMEKNGLITREAIASDARAKRIILTPKAIALDQEIGQKAMIIEERMTVGLSDSEVELFFNLLDKIKKNMEEI